MRIVKEIFPQNSYFWTVALQFRINERSWYSFVFLNDRDTVSYYWTILMQFRITEWSWCSFVLLSDRDAVSYYWTILMQFRINERSWCHFVYLNSSVAFSNKWTLLVPNMYFPFLHHPYFTAIWKGWYQAIYVQNRERGMFAWYHMSYPITSLFVVGKYADGGILYGQYLE